jgi:hypothetical protein
MRKSKKSKRNRDKKTEHQKKPSEEQVQSSETKVRGAIEVHSSVESKELHKSERQEDTTQKGKEYALASRSYSVSKAAVLISALYFVATCLIFIETKKSADAAKQAADIARDTLKISQGSYVSIGRKDGTVADIIVPKEPGQNAAIVIYFQNSGHLSAKFAWGTTASYLVTGSTKKSTGINYIHPYKDFYVTRDKKTGAEGQIGASSIIAGDSVFASTLGEISQNDLSALASSNMGTVISGMYHYCDEIGNNVWRNFLLEYRSNSASTNLSFWVEDESTLPNMPPHPGKAFGDSLPCGGEYK